MTKSVLKSHKSPGSKPDPMTRERISALIVRHVPDRVELLRSALEGLSFRTLWVRSCSEARAHLLRAQPPHLVVTDVALPDGAWSDILEMASRAARPVGVIVVSPTADVESYLRVMEAGAFNFITDSFTVREIVFAILGALENVVARRGASSPGSPRQRPRLATRSQR